MGVVGSDFVSLLALYSYSTSKQDTLVDPGIG